MKEQEKLFDLIRKIFSERLGIPEDDPMIMESALGIVYQQRRVDKLAQRLYRDCLNNYTGELDEDVAASMANGCLNAAMMYVQVHSEFETENMARSIEALAQKPTKPEVYSFSFDKPKS